MPRIEPDQVRIRESDGRRMQHTFVPVAIVHDAGEWYFYERGDDIPARHRTAAEKDAQGVKG